MLQTGFVASSPPTRCSRPQTSVTLAPAGGCQCRGSVSGHTGTGWIRAIAETVITTSGTHKPAKLARRNPATSANPSAQAAQSKTLCTPFGRCAKPSQSTPDAVAAIAANASVAPLARAAQQSAGRTSNTKSCSCTNGMMKSSAQLAIAVRSVVSGKPRTAPSVSAIATAANPK